MTPVQVFHIFSKNINNDVEKLELSYTAGSNVEWYILENNLEIPQKFKNTVTLLTINSIPRCIPKRNKDI